MMLIVRPCSTGLLQIWQAATTDEFAKANEKARSEKAALEMRKQELTTLLSHARASEAMVERIPQAIKSFREASQSLEPRQQKAQLQTILKAATIFSNGKIELEFRGEGSSK